MRVAVFGLGYVGAVASACLAERGHRVVAVDKNATKIAIVRRGESPLAETGLAELIAHAVDQGVLLATGDAALAVHTSELSLICVGTPSLPNGDVQLTDLAKVCSEIGEALATTEEFHLIVVSSTIPPGTTRGLVIPTIEAASGKRHGREFAVCMSPEFLREGSAVSDYFHPRLRTRHSVPLSGLWGRLGPHARRLGTRPLRQHHTLLVLLN